MAKKSKEEESPPMRSVLEEGRDAITLMREAYPAVLGLNQQYGPDFARSEVANAQARSNAEASAIAADGGKLRSAIMGASPEVAAATQAQMARLGELGPTAIESEMQSQALADLKRGRDMSPEQIRDAQQAARSGFSARGMATGTSAVIAEILNRDAMATARQNERRAFASGVDAQRTQRVASDASVANNVGNSLIATWDPQVRMFGRGGSAITGQVSGPSQYTPFLGAAQDVGRTNQATAYDWMNAEANRSQAMEMFNAEREDTRYYTQFNARMAQQNASDARSSNLTGSAIGAGGAILGAVLAAMI